MVKLYEGVKDSLRILGCIAFGITGLSALALIHFDGTLKFIVAILMVANFCLSFQFMFGVNNFTAEELSKFPLVEPEEQKMKRIGIEKVEKEDE